MPNTTAPHATNLRRGRFSEFGRTYLITTTTHERRPIFRNFRAGRLLVNEMRLSEQNNLVESLAWVICRTICTGCWCCAMARWPTC